MIRSFQQTEVARSYAIYDALMKRCLATPSRQNPAMAPTIYLLISWHSSDCRRG